MRSKRNKRFGLAVSSLAVIALVLSTVGPISIGQAGAAGKTKVHPAKGAPINFAGLCADAAPNIVPGCWKVIQAVFKNYNAAGGYKGRPLSYTFADNSSPTTLIANINQFALNNKYLAFLGVSTDSGIGAITQPLHMAVLGDGGLSADDATYPNLFSFSAYSRGSALANVNYYISTNSDVNPFGVFLNNAAGEGAWATISGVLAQAAGESSVPTSPIAVTDTSFDPIAVLIQANKYDPVVTLAIGSEIAGIVQAASALGVHTTFIQTFTCVDDSYLATVASIPNEKLFCAAPFNLTKARSEIYAALNKAHFQINFDYQYNAIESYLAAKAAIKALSLVKGKLTRASFLKAVSSMTFSDPALVGSDNFSKPGPDSTSPSYRNYEYNIYQVVSGKLVQENAQPVNVAP